MRIALQTLEDHQLLANLKEVKFSGHVVSWEGITVDFVKIDMVLMWSSPRNALKVQTFLGLVGY